MRRKKKIEGERIVDRLRVVLFDMNKNETQMSRECGVPMGVISNAKRPGNDLSELQYRRILEKYKFINEAWFVKGEGPRYNDGRESIERMTITAPAIVGDSNVNNQVVAHSDGANAKLLEQIGEQYSRLREQYTRLQDEYFKSQERNAQLLEQNNKLQDMNMELNARLFRLLEEGRPARHAQIVRDTPE